MNYAKIKNDVVVKFPFTINDLQIENQSTNFGVVLDRIAVYAETDEGLSGAFLVKVEEAEMPTINIPYEYIERKEMPELINGKYVIGWNVIQKSTEETNAILTSIAETVSASPATNI